MNTARKKICFAASSGGHLEEIMNLKPLMLDYESFIATEKTSYTLSDKKIMTYYYCQVNRKEILCIFKLLMIACKALLIYLKEKPDIVISTGALSTIPLCLICKIFRKKVIYIESYANVESPSKTGTLMYHFADMFYVQWKDMKKYYPESIFAGSVF